MNFLNAGPSLSNKDIANFEREIGVFLPEEYPVFLLRQNGGRPDPGTFRFGSKGESHVDELYSLIQSVDSGMRLAFRHLLGTPPRMPKDMLPVGCDDGGNQICLATSGPKTGSVYLWDHEKEGEYGHPTHYENLYPITDNFASFLDSLFAVSAEEMAVRSEPYRILKDQDVPALKHKIQLGFDIDSQLSNGLTFLENAAVYDDVNIASYLLDNGAAVGNAKGIATRARSIGVLKLIEARRIN